MELPGRVYFFVTIAQAVYIIIQLPEKFLIFRIVEVGEMKFPGIERSEPLGRRKIVKYHQKHWLNALFLF
jgi:hypothetical protein